MLTAAETTGFLLVGLPAAVLVDRLHRRSLMLWVNVGRAILLAAVPLAWWLGVLTVACLAAIALLVGLLTVFFDIAYQSYLPSLVGRDRLAEGNAKLQASQSTAQVTGPAVAGWLTQLAGAANAVLTTGVGFLVSALLLWRISSVEPATAGAPRRSMWSGIGEGLRFVLGHPLLRSITGYTATANLFNGVGTAVMMLFLVRELRLSAGEAGLLVTAASAGGVLGALTSSLWIRVMGQARTIWLAPALLSPLALFTPLANQGPTLALFIVGEAASSYGAVVYNVAQVSFRQLICPDRLLGRMNASVRFLVWGTLPLGGFAGGALAQWIGARATLWVAAGGGLAAVLWLVTSRLTGVRELPAGLERAD